MKLKTLVAAAFAAALLAPASALAGGYEWTGEGNGSSWTDACNWWPKNQCQQKYPEKPEDSASIAPLPGKSPPRVTLGENLTLASVSLSGPSSITGGSLDITRSFSWSGGGLYTKVSIGRLAIGSISGTDQKTLGADITNSNILVIGGGRISVSPGVKLTNRPLAVMTISHGSRLDGLQCCVKPARVINDGKLIVAGGPIPIPGANTATISNVSFVASGSQSIKGTFQLEKAPGVFDVGTRFDGGGTVRITNGARIELGGPFNVSKGTTLELASAGGSIFQGGLLGKGKMFGGGELVWKGGRIDATLELDGIQTILEGPDEKSLAGSIVNDGHAIFFGSGDKKKPTGPLVMGQKSKWLNLGSFVAYGGVRINGLVCCNTPAVFDNEGVFSVVRNPKLPGERVVVSNIRFYAAGEVHLERAGLEVLNGLATLANTLKLTGKGTLELFTAADTTIQGRVDAEEGTRVLLLGDLDGKGSLGGGGVFVWRTGTINAELAIEKDSLFAFDGSTEKYFGEKAKLVTRGEAVLTPDRKPQTVRFYPPSRYVNAGTLTIHGSTDFRGQSCCRNPAYLVNLGEIKLDRDRGGPAPALALYGVFVENRGTVDVNTGVIHVEGAPYVQHSGATRLTGGRLVSLEVTDLQGGLLAGTGEIHTNVWNRGGTISPGDPDTQYSTGVLRITGDFRQVSGSLKIDIKGPVVGGGYDQFVVEKGATLGGRLDIRTADGWSPAMNTRVNVLDAKLARHKTFTQAGSLFLPGGKEWGVQYHNSGVSLVARRA